MVRHVSFDIKVVKATGSSIENTTAAEQERQAADPQWIALTEACLLHQRNLLGFLFAPKVRDQREGDVFAIDYFDGPADWTSVAGNPELAAVVLGREVPELKKLISTRLAHVCLARLDSVEWRSLIVANELLSVIEAFVSTVPQPYRAGFEAELSQPL